ncbi:MAG: UPF0175 family protein [Methanomassiliicoccales archaeon]|jgi:uncharacterized protein YwgA
MAQLWNQLNDEEKIVLYCIGSLQRPLRSKLKLQKILFLVTNVFPDLQDLLRFEPNLLGPYSDKIDYVLQDLQSLDLVANPEGGIYILTKEGQEIFKNIKPKQELAGVIQDFKLFLNDLSDNEIMTFIYTFYPKYTSESARWDDLKKDRIDYAIRLLLKGKVSYSKASEMAGLELNDFDDLLRRRRVQWRSTQ